MNIETERLIITEFNSSMAEAVHINSLDEDTKRFLPDEVFESVEIAEETINFLMSVYKTGDGPLVYPVLMKDGSNIGYVQLVPIAEGYEIGYHIAKPYTKKGYATEAVRAFIEYIAQTEDIDRIHGICAAENIASIRVLHKCGFIKVAEGEGTYQGKVRNIVRFILKLKG